MKIRKIIKVLLIIMIIQKLSATDIQTKISYPNQNTCNGKINITISGGYPMYDLTWTGPTGVIKQVSGVNGYDGQEDIDNLCPNLEYCVSITDALCGVLNYCWTLQNCPIITLNNQFIIVNPSGCDDENGSLRSITGGPNGGTWPYTEYLEHHEGQKYYRTLPLNYLYENLKAGKYKLVVTDANGCTGEIKDIYIIPEEGFRIELEEIQHSCSGSNNGRISIYTTSNDLSETVNYSWSNGVDHNNIPIFEYSILDNLGSGEYCVTITSNKTTCTLKECFTINASGNGGPLNLTATLLHPCKNMQNGKLLVTASGGTLPYTYNWNPANFIIGLPAKSGIYCVTVTDVCGASVNECYELKDVEFSFNFGITCKDDGWAELTPMNEASPMNIYWFKQGSGIFQQGAVKRVENLSNGSYHVWGSDKNGCSFSYQFEIEYKNKNYVSFVKNNTICNQDNVSRDGEIHIGSIDNRNYTFLWTGPNGFTSTDRNIKMLTPGKYKVEITTPDGCKEFLEEIICCCGATNTDYPTCQGINIEINYSTDEKDPITSESKDGYIKVIEVNGGSGKYYYKWAGPDNFLSTSSSIIGLDEGEYCVTISDGCKEKIKCLVLKGCNSKSINPNTQVIHTCQDVSFGSISIINVNGDNPPYNYEWSNGSKNKEQNDLSNGSYTVTITDNRKCRFIKTYTINESVNFGSQNCLDGSCAFCETCNSRETGKSNLVSPITKYDGFDCSIKFLVCPINNRKIGNDLRANIRYEWVSHECKLKMICEDGSFRLKSSEYKINELLKGFIVDDNDKPECFYCYTAGKACTIAKWGFYGTEFGKEFHNDEGPFILKWQSNKNNDFTISSTDASCKLGSLCKLKVTCQGHIIFDECVDKPELCNINYLINSNCQRENDVPLKRKKLFERNGNLNYNKIVEIYNLGGQIVANNLAINIEEFLLQELVSNKLVTGIYIIKIYSYETNKYIFSKLFIP